MGANLTLLLGVGVLFSTGTYMLMERSLTRVLLGFVLVSNGANLLVLHMAGPGGSAPIITEGASSGGISDPLPQALILTAIVITLGVTAFVLAMIYRSWRLAHEDTVLDDTEDQRVATGVGADEEETATVDEDEVESSESEFEDSNQ